MARPHRLLNSRRFWVVALVGFLVAALSWHLGAYPRGAVEAYIDRARGHYEVKANGYPSPESVEYAALLRDRYGVVVNPVAGCVVSEPLGWYVSGDNAVSVRRLNEQFGRDIFAECWAEARWRADHPEEAQK